MIELYRDNGFAILTDVGHDNLFNVSGEPAISTGNVAENWAYGVFRRLGLAYTIVKVEDITHEDAVGRWHDIRLTIK